LTATSLSHPGERQRLSSKLAQIDWTFCLVITLIAVAGGLMLFSIAGMSWTPWARPHLIRYAVFFVIMLVLAMVDLRVWFGIAYPVYVLGLVLLLAVAAVGHTSLGAQRWLELPVVGQFQPSEVMKVGIVLALARFYHGLSSQNAKLSWWLLIPAGLIAVPVALVAHQPDLGTALLILATGVTIMVLAGLSLRLMIVGAVAVAVAAPAAFFFVMHDYQRQRILTFLHPEADQSGAGYHVIQSEIALGHGGLLGMGFGLGSQAQLNFLPEKQTDFIFATLAEEFGFVGCISILALYAAAIYMGIRIATVSHSHFGRLSAAGVTATFALYVLINGAMVMGLAPVVGVPMPLLSWGGTVMITVMLGFALLMAVRVHRYSEVTSGKGALV
jgi:rod shape determining protein RodA